MEVTSDNSDASFRIMTDAYLSCIQGGARTHTADVTVEPVGCRW